MTNKRPAKLTRRLVPHLHKPRRHGTTHWLTWMPTSRIAFVDSFRHGHRRGGL